MSHLVQEKQHIWTFHQMPPKGHSAFIVCYPIFKWPFELWSWNSIYSFFLITLENHVKFSILVARSVKRQPNNLQNLTFFLPRGPPVGTTENTGDSLLPLQCQRTLHSIPPWTETIQVPGGCAAVPIHPHIQFFCWSNLIWDLSTTKNSWLNLTLKKAWILLIAGRKAYGSRVPQYLAKFSHSYTGI